MPSTNNNKTAGSDQLEAELVKFLDRDYRDVLLNGINKVLASGIFETNMHATTVVSIYKKGDSSLLANYRPSFLLQTFYEIIAALIKAWLTEGLDEWINSIWLQKIPKHKSCIFRACTARSC